MKVITPQDGALLPDGSGGGNPSNVVATLDQTIDITGDVAGVYATFWTASSVNELGAVYYLTLYAEIYNTTLNVGCSLVNFSVQWTSNGVPTDLTPGPLPLDAPGSLADVNGQANIDDGTVVEWKIDVGGWASGSGTLRVKASLMRLV